MKSKTIVIVLGLLLMSTAALAKNKTVTFKVDGQCDDCKERIETTLDNPGISYAQWDVDTKMLTVRYNSKKYSEDDIHKLVSDIGYDTSKMKANKKAQTALPKCCQPGGH